MDVLSYKGYTGTVERSGEDDCLFGKVVGVKSLLSYEGNSLQGLEKDFRSVIDGYLNDCKERGIAPERSKTAQIAPEEINSPHDECVALKSTLGETNTALGGIIATINDMNTSIEKMEKRRAAWDFAIGLQAVDDKTVSPELLELAEKEIRGEITTEEIIEILKEKYRET